MDRKMRELIHEINDIEDKIEEARTKGKEFTNSNRMEEAKAKIKEIEDLREIKSKLKAAYQKEEKELEEKKEEVRKQIEGGENVENNTTKLIKNAIYPNEKISNATNKKDDLDFGKLVKGMTGKGWNNAQKEQEYYNMNTSGNEVLIPRTLSDHILDVARTQSALFGKIPMVRMDSNNLKIAIQTKDAQANFVGEGDLIPTSDVIFDSVDLEGKTLAIYIPITEQLLDSTNIAPQLTQSVAKAIVNALDKALLYGTGENSIIGLENIETVEKIAHTTNATNYDFVVAGTKAIKKANLIPSNIVYNSDLSSDLEIAKTADGQYLGKPQFMDNYITSESNNIKENQAIIYDVNSLLLGMNKDITISWGYVSDDFQRLKKGLRVHLRADFTPIRKDGVKIVNINKSV